MTNIIAKTTLSKAQNLSMCLLALFILVDVECLGTESGSEQEMQPGNNPEPQFPSLNANAVLNLILPINSLANPDPSAQHGGLV